LPRTHYPEGSMRNKKLRKEATQHGRPVQEQLQRERLQGVLELAGAVCHELNQPMQVIVAYCGLLLRDVSYDNALYAYIEKIQEQVDRMEKVTRKLMGVKTYQTKEYIEGIKIIDIDKASRMS
jgi:signal transduction histidine kinase